MASFPVSDDRLGHSNSSLTVNGDGNDGPSSLSQSPESSFPPQRPQLGRRAFTALDLAAHTPRRSRVERGGEREWTVFGQLMTDNGQLRSPDSSPNIKKRHSRRSIRASVPPTSMHSRPDSILEQGASVVQSPIQGSFPELERERTTALHTDYDSVSDSETDSTIPVSTPPPAPPTRWRMPEIPILYRNILKCAVAYFLGSLWTYVTPLSLMIGSITSEGDRVPFPSGHMVATV